MEHRRELVDVGDGVLEVEVTGRGEAVVLIQTALTVDELRPLAQGLASIGEFQVLHCHRRGYAGSGPARDRGSVLADAADVAALVRARCTAFAHVVGVSYSAAVGLSLASTAPELVRTLGVVEPPPVGTPGAADFRRANRELLERHRALGPTGALDAFMAMLEGEGWRQVHEHEAPGSVAAMERDAPAFFGSDVPALLSWQFGVEEAARVRCPVLCLGGDRTGPWFAEMRARVAHLLPQAETGTIEGADHLVAGTHPEEVAVRLVEQLRRHPL